MQNSIVEYFYGQDGYGSCGYCKSSNTFCSTGMWAHSLTPLDYQNLIDRGWRRSGKYCYKPGMKLTCCPLYTIRCEAKHFTLTKSQKKVLKKVNKFLIFGDRGQRTSTPTSENSEQEMDGVEITHDIGLNNLKRIKNIKPISVSNVQNKESESTSNLKDEDAAPSVDTQSPLKSSLSPLASSSIPNQDNSNRPQCQKAKTLRRERKLQKLLQKGIDPEVAAASLKKTPNQPKSLEEFLFEPQQTPNPAHKLELKLVSVDSDEFNATLDQSFSVYVRYQMAIHKDTEEECNLESYENFLVETPIENSEKPTATKKCAGSYHQQYWLDNKLIAVAVLDILPHCVSSVYFYYDPDYRFLSLGTYSALREIAFTRELNLRHNDLQYYYMGYYIHSCIKMRYKGQYVPSFLLCPETYTFHPIEKCKLLLDKSKYSRLHEDPEIDDPDGKVVLKDVLVLYKSTKMPYLSYCSAKHNSRNDEAEVKEYAKLVGRKCYRRIMLYRT